MLPAQSCDFVQFLDLTLRLPYLAFDLCADVPLYRNARWKPHAVASVILAFSAILDPLPHSSKELSISIPSFLT